MPSRLGILIAGSLHWRTAPYREAWRKACLNADAALAVKAPIRYGRFSETSQTYTMVYAPGCPDGQAKVMGCLRPVSSIAEVVEQAEALWVAERPPNSRPLPGRKHSADWGCVALLLNQNGAAHQRLLDEWAERVSLERDQHGQPTYDNRHFTVRGASAINNRGILQIPWPAQVDNDEALDSFDLLLATATRPTPDRTTGDFPSAAAVAEAWNKRGDAEYFRMNRKHGFHTFQDQEIDSLLRV
jgi:hypothetical protein